MLKMLTAFTEEIDDAGMGGHVGKPIDKDEILQRLAKFLPG